MKEILTVYRVIPTEKFEKWLNSFKEKDFEVVRRIVARQLAMTQGHFGHTRSVGEGFWMWLPYLLHSSGECRGYSFVRRQ